MDILESFDFVQHIDKPTHNSGHLLDYIITRKDSSGVSNVFLLSMSLLLVSFSYLLILPGS